MSVHPAVGNIQSSAAVTSGLSATAAATIVDLKRRVTVLENTPVAIAPDSITGQAIAPASITTGEIAAGTITSGNIAAGSITGLNIQAGTITSNEIAANTIRAENIAASTITAAQIRAQTITSVQIAASTITAANITAGAINATHIQAGAIDSSHIRTASLNATVIEAQTITAAQIAANTITTAQLAAGSITANNIASKVITADHIVAQGISANEIKANTITAAQIQAQSITGDRITARSITATEILASTITATEIAAATITSVQLAANSVTATQLTVNSVYAAAIQANAVDATKISVTNLQSVSGTMGTVTGGIFQTQTVGPRVLMGTNITTTEGTKNGIVGVDGSNNITFLIEPITGDARFKGNVLGGSTGLGNIDGLTQNASILAGGNLLTGNPSLDTSDLTPYTPNVYNASLSRDTGFFFTSPASLKVVSGTSGIVYVGAGTSGGVPAVLPSTAYSFAANVYSAKTLPSALQINWYDSVGGLISYTAATLENTIPGQWKKFRYENVISPSNAAYAIPFFISTASAASDTYWIDNFVFTKGAAAIGSVVVANSITAAEISVGALSAISANLGTVTAGTVSGVTLAGSTIKTGPIAGTVNNIVMDASGLRAYDGSGTNTLNIDTGTGSLTAIGGTITGAVFRTAASPSARAEIDSSGYKVYDASNALATSLTTGVYGSLEFNVLTTSSSSGGSTVRPAGSKGPIGSTIRGVFYRRQDDATIANEDFVVTSRSTSGASVTGTGVLHQNSSYGTGVNRAEQNFTAEHSSGNKMSLSMSANSSSGTLTIYGVTAGVPNGSNSVFNPGSLEVQVLQAFKGTVGGVKLQNDFVTDADSIYSCLASDTSTYKALMILGNRSAAGGGRTIKMYDDVTVQNTFKVGPYAQQAAVVIGCNDFYNSSGSDMNTTNDGMYFPYSGYYVFAFGGTGYSSTAGASVSINLYIDGNYITQAFMYMNPANTHTTIYNQTLVNVGQGYHVVALRRSAALVQDTNDRWHYSVTKYGAPGVA